MKTCLQCEKELVGRDKQKFCSRSCSATFNNKLRGRKRGNCLNCGKLLRVYGSRYCDKHCQKQFGFDSYINRWLEGEESGVTGVVYPRLSRRIRIYLLEQGNYRCGKCGWGEINRFSNTVPLEIDHIDGNCLNNRPENLRVLCPNCHSLTPTHKGLNIKNSQRKSRPKKNYRK